MCAFFFEISPKSVLTEVFQIESIVKRARSYKKYNFAEMLQCALTVAVLAFALCNACSHCGNGRMDRGP